MGPINNTIYGLTRGGYCTRGASHAGRYQGSRFVCLVKVFGRLSSCTRSGRACYNNGGLGVDQTFQLSSGRRCTCTHRGRNGQFGLRVCSTSCGVKSGRRSPFGDHGDTRRRRQDRYVYTIVPRRYLGTRGGIGGYGGGRGLPQFRYELVTSL